MCISAKLHVAGKVADLPTKLMTTKANMRPKGAVASAAHLAVQQVHTEQSAAHACSITLRKRTDQQQSRFRVSRQQLRGEHKHTRMAAERAKLLLQALPQAKPAAGKE